MSIKGKARQGGEGFTKKIGVGVFSVIAINPTKEELAKLLNITEEEKIDSLRDPEYLFEKTNDGGQEIKGVRIAVWVEEEKTKQKYSFSLSLRDNERVSKTGKPQWINNLGRTTWADDKDNLPEWFTGKDGNEIGFRKAKEGEEELYKFLSAWQHNIDWKTIDDFTVDLKPLFKGNVKELRSLIGSEYAGPIMALVTVRKVEGENGDDDKYYQSFWTRNFLPGYAMKKYRTAGKDADKNLQYFWEGIEEPEYGCKEIYVDTELVDFKPEEHFASAGKTIDSSNSDY